MKEVFVRLDRCLGCKSCEMACAVEHSAGKSLISAISEKPGPVRRVYVEMAEGQKMPLVCRHCEDAPCVRCKNLDIPACVAACPTGTLIFATQQEFVEMMRKEAALRIAREAKGLAKA
jgi:carbon-monoxide dehydrogenase iron sulfur subunit